MGRDPVLEGLRHPGKQSESQKVVALRNNGILVMVPNITRSRHIGSGFEPSWYFLISLLYTFFGCTCISKMILGQNTC